MDAYTRQHAHNALQGVIGALALVLLVDCASGNGPAKLTQTQEAHNAARGIISTAQLGADPSRFAGEYVHLECYVTDVPRRIDPIEVHATCGTDKNDGMAAQTPAVRAAYGDAALILTGDAARSLLDFEMSRITGVVLPSALAIHAPGSNRPLPTIRVDYLK